ncbi:MarR family winged helix-turn-helix transcriptional regulator [Microbacterium amylolyticum]|uniref:DNA-binding MarR family transcriptional regulator n=1 Tax=Microbacterium amylolyticum TaxID=936337 RepID=A0ABS4ZF20_9MICO|nr:MarR family transcriptional regulator [Microbacterium amylolyticum]MBP2435876.1 DNA-binding MarR family transcriptional regulator [Microbacterium amylolyticum]
MSPKIPPQFTSPLTMLDPRVLDPDETLVQRSHLSDADISQSVEVLEAMHRWREAEQAMSEASRRYMKLGDTDMRALRFLITSRSQRVDVTPSALAAHLRISTASTTKMLDRLAKAGHIVRQPHPHDRRRLTIEITDETRNAARASVGRSHARRFDVVAALSPAERAAIVAFFNALTATTEDGLVSDEGSLPDDTAEDLRH